jgi:type I restriction enzyme S subunit
MYPKGSVAIALYGATIGKTSILGIDSTTNQACAVGIPCLEVTTSEYLYHFLSSQRNAFINEGQGGAQPNISQGIVKNWPIPLAPLAEQKRIADKLDALLAKVDACRRRLDRVPALIKRFRQAVLAAATAGELTENWRTERSSLIKTVPFQDLLSKESGSIRRGPFGSTIKKSFFVPSGYKVYEQRNAIQNDSNLGDYYIDEEKYQELQAFAVQPGDFLVSCAGTIGRITQLPWGSKKGVINQALMRLRIDRAVISDEFFLILFRSPHFQASILEETQGSAMQNMTAISNIKLLSVQLPSLLEQVEIVRRVEVLFAFAERLEAHYLAALAHVEKLTPALLAKAFRGELVPQDLNDEPASALLERIRAERAGQGALFDGAPKRRRKTS